MGKRQEEEVEEEVEEEAAAAEGTEWGRWRRKCARRLIKMFNTAASTRRRSAKLN